jgi:glycosyltransferase involved in cell wall biosynthesis
MIKFSIIIPAYNRFDMVQKAINSVLLQTYPHYELIVVDDGSTDDTYKISNIFKDKIKLIKQENLGVSAARNKGIEISSHEYIAFLDSDDIWLPEKLQEHVNFIQENPQIKIHQTAEKWIRNGRQVSPAKYHIKFGGDIFFESL